LISFHLAVVHVATFAKCFSIRPVTGSGYVSGGRLTDAIGVGVLTRLIHRDLVDEVLVQTDRVQKCSRLLPARVVVYYVLALFFGDSYEEVVRLLVDGLARLGTWKLFGNCVLDSLEG